MPPSEQIVIGQRWTSATETQLGLGIVVEVGPRRMTVSFPAVGERRTYAIDGAPLSRIRYAVGDAVRDHDHARYQINEVIERDSLLAYRCADSEGTDVVLSEVDLNAFVQFTTPKQRLLNGQFDRAADFELRVDTLRHLDRLQRSPLVGLLGSRTDLLEHQIHIAHEVAKRHAPRVLLADEVGLGKTIEAGMILHHQIHTGRAQRVLIVVPDSLVHQWLVEMLRRFNLPFAIFDAPRLEALADDDFDNPFDSEQRVLCSLSFLTANEEAREQAIAAQWDMVIVDEAHHLRWPGADDTAADPLHADGYAAYRCIERLAQRSAGLLLLTATPEQLGVASHFARLRLLDPARFHDLDAFLAEDARYGQLNAAVAPLLDDGAALDSDARSVLEQFVDAPLGPLDEPAQRVALLGDLLDRHGTGRVLFRNTRAAIGNFVAREPRPTPLPMPEFYANQKVEDVAAALYPESVCGDESWLQHDPRVDWLVTLLKTRPLDKVLVICHRMETAKALDAHLTLREGIRSTSFYQGLSIVERDRAAAYFAEGQDDPGGGAQTLICSEIGSEGRNFQFAHQLVLFDLPLSPDLLEQRIGRLDRIGQQQAIQIHVPYLTGSAQETLYQWYQRGIGSFKDCFAAGQTVFEKFAEPLLALLGAHKADARKLDDLLVDTAQFSADTREALRNGRDRLLELNSCNARSAGEIIENIRSEEDSGELQAYAEQVFEQYGVDQEFHSKDSWVLRPGEKMSGHFPGLGSDGTSITYSRAKALAREDLQFMSWEHPMLCEAMEMIHGSELGNTSLTSIRLKTLPAATLLLEAYVTSNVVAPAILNVERYLPLNPSRLLLLANGKDVAEILSHSRLNTLSSPIPADTARKVIAQIRGQVETMIGHAIAAAEARLPAQKVAASASLERDIGARLARLTALRKVNPSIREDEIAFLERRLREGREYIDRAEIRVEALRVIVNH